MVASGDRPESLLDEFLATYANGKTRRSYRALLTQLPANPTSAHLVRWATGVAGQYSNNTVRSRITAATAYYDWAASEGHPVPNLHALRKLRRQYPKTYGKVQSKNPARWLTHADAFGKLIDACRDGGALAERDELAIRLGLSGMRVSEIANLNIGDLDLHQPLIQWMGKGNRPRRITPSSQLLALLERWLTTYAANLGHAPTDEMPLVCAGMPRGYQIRWGTRINNAPRSLGDMVNRRARQAGLGHVTPHDLRRSAAGILHHAKSDDGGHRFDLLDIQKVLGHADPATTMRSYLDPMDTDVLDRAANYLD